MLLSSHTGPAPKFTGDIFPSHAAYAERLGLPYLIHQAEGDPFEHRLPSILTHGADLTLYVEWDVRIADDAPDILPMLGDADLMIPRLEDPGHARWLEERTPGLSIPWHIIGVMLGRREAFEAIHSIFPSCRHSAAGLPTAAARYEGAVLLAIQHSGIKVVDLPDGLHKFARRHHSAAFLHFEGDTKAKLKGKKPTMTCATGRHADRGTSGMVGVFTGP